MTSLSGHSIGFIGLGLMGKPMSTNLMAAGATVVGFDPLPANVEAMAAKGLIPAESPAAVAAQADTVILMTSNTLAVEAVLFGENGAVAAMKPGSLLMDMGTTAVMATRRFAASVNDAGCDYVDAPVSGGTIGAIAGNLTIMAGGTEAAFARAHPILEVLGGRITHVGPVSHGQVAKAANQVIVGLNIGAAAEALTLAKQAGADPAKIREALQGGFADSRILEVHGKRMIDDDFTPGGTIVVQHKDMTQALDLAEELGFDLPATRLNRGLYEGLIAEGFGELDHAGLIKALGPGK